MRPSGLYGIGDLENALNNILNQYVDMSLGKTEEMLLLKAQKIEREIADNVTRWANVYINTFIGHEEAKNGRSWPQLAESTKKKKAALRAKKKRGETHRNLKNEFFVFHGNLRKGLTSLNWNSVLGKGRAGNKYLQQGSLTEQRYDKRGRKYHVVKTQFFYDGKIRKGKVAATIAEAVKNVTITLRFFEALEKQGYFRAPSPAVKEKIVGERISSLKSSLTNKLFGKSNNIGRRPFLNDVLERIIKNDVSNLIEKNLR